MRRSTATRFLHRSPGAAEPAEFDLEEAKRRLLKRAMERLGTYAHNRDICDDIASVLRLETAVRA